MIKIIAVVLLTIGLTGCASFSFGTKVKPIEVVAKPIERTPLDIPLPDPLKLKPLEWMLITPANQEEIFSRLETRGDDVVLIGLSDDGYQQLAITMAELRNLINLQRSIIIKYKEYYEPKKDAEKK
jgi:hypothetical protein